MSSEIPTPQPPTPAPQPAAAADPGLPPVTPPSGRQMLQLFIVPGIIVLILVGLFLLGPTLSGWFTPGKSADQFLTDLDSPNEEVCYRAASDLAQMLPRKERRAEELARDVSLCVGLAERLASALERSAEAEKTFAARFESMKEEDRLRELKALDRDRNLITYLAASLGHVSIPVGVPLLGRMATQTDGMEPEALAERRRRALFALATLGAKVKSYDELPDEVKDDVEDKLEQAAKKSGEAGRGARVALDGLRARRAGKPTTMGVASFLDRTAGDSDPSLRQWTAFAANQWRGTPEEEKVMEDFLVTLANDAGVGTDKLAERLAENPETKQARAVTKTKGYNVRVEGTLALARRGSGRVSAAMLAELLEPAKLREIFIIEQEAAPERQKRFLFWTWTEPAVPAERPNEPLVVLTVTEALKAVAEWHRKRPEADVKALLPLIEELEKSDNAGLAAQAKQTREALTS